MEMAHTNPLSYNFPIPTLEVNIPRHGRNLELRYSYPDRRNVCGMHTPTNSIAWRSRSRQAADVAV